MTCRSSASWRRPAGLAAVLSLAVFASGCSSNDKEAKGPACPRVGVLADAAQLVQFAGTGTETADLVYRAQMVNAAGSCEYDDDHVEVALAVQVHAMRGAAGTAGAYQTRYFLAVVDANDRILAKKQFPLSIVFEGGKQQSVVRDSVETMRIPVKSEKAGATYQILFGFELTRDQVIYNRVTSGMSRNGT